MRTLTNDYRDSKVMNLGSGNESGPYLVTQTGVSPNDPVPRTHFFVCDQTAAGWTSTPMSARGNPEALDEIVFPNMPKVMEVFARLRGRADVVDLPIDEAGLKAWIERQKGSDPLQAAKAWAPAVQRTLPAAQKNDFIRITQLA
jgi:hypothetical protein